MTAPEKSSDWRRLLCARNTRLPSRRRLLFVASFFLSRICGAPWPKLHKLKICGPEIPRDSENSQNPGESNGSGTKKWNQSNG